MGLGPVTGTEGRERPELAGVQLGRAEQKGALHGGVYMGVSGKGGGKKGWLTGSMDART